MFTEKFLLITELFIVILVWMTLTFKHELSCMRNQNSCSYFLTNFSNVSDEISLLPQHVGLLKRLLNSFYMIKVQGREFYFADFIIDKFNIGMHSDVYDDRHY